MRRMELERLVVGGYDSLSGCNGLGGGGLMRWMLVDDEVWCMIVSGRRIVVKTVERVV